MDVREEEVFIPLPPVGSGKITDQNDFRVNTLFGSASYVVPLQITPARGLTPPLALSYHSEGGRSVFGHGFELNIAKISRSTLNGVPYYEEDRDSFIYQGEELVRISANSQNPIIYRPRVEKDFSVIEYWANQDKSYWVVKQTDGITHVFGKSKKARTEFYDKESGKEKIFGWNLEETCDAKGNKILYVYDNQSFALAEFSAEEVNSLKQFMATDFKKIQALQLENDQYKSVLFTEKELVDIKQNLDHINTEVAKELNSKIEGTPSNYLQQINYGNLNSQGEQEENWVFSVKFNYKSRPDSYCTYKLGFKLSIKQRCSKIELLHLFPDNQQKRCVKSWDLLYEISNEGLSRLSALQQKGYRYLSHKAEPLTKECPKVSFSYADFAPHPSFKQDCLLNLNDKEQNEHAVLGNLPFRFVDLYREGLPGILYSDDVNTLYWRNLGDATFSDAKTLGNFPIDRNLNSRRHQLLDFAESDQLALVVGDINYGGFYENIDPYQQTWENFQEFEEYPTDFIHPMADFVDLNGSGQEDLLMLDTFNPLYYPSLGKKGFAKPQDLQLPSDFPLLRPTDADEFIAFGKIFGDGLPHRIRILPHQIECWPNMGHGKFGEKIIIPGPDFGEDFDASRLFLIDTSGKGCVDLVYVSSHEINIYLNEQGRSFATKVISVSLPDLYTHADQIRLVDLFGEGTPCLVFTKMDKDYKHYYYKFCEHPTNKPNLLKEINNGLGKKITIEYDSAVKSYIRDLNTIFAFSNFTDKEIEQLKKWVGKYFKKIEVLNPQDNNYERISLTKEEISEIQGKLDEINTEESKTLSEKLALNNEAHKPRFKCSFPVSVVSQYSIQDNISQMTLAKRFQYHDGYYDPQEKRFAGFGYVEHWDTSEADENNRDLLTRWTKHWYFMGENSFLNFLPKNHQLTFNPLQLMPKDADEELRRQANVALGGALLREEVYSIAYQKNPLLYAVTEKVYDTLFIKEGEKTPLKVFTVRSKETMNFDYQENLDDPKVQHQLNLTWDEFNHVLDAFVVYYPRFTPLDNVELKNPLTHSEMCKYVLPEQQVLSIIAKHSEIKSPTFIKADDNQQQFQFIGLPKAVETYEIDTVYFTDVIKDSQKNLDSFIGSIKKAVYDFIYEQIHEKPLNFLKSVLQHQQFFYWDEEERGSEIKLPLLHHVENLVESQTVLEEIYKSSDFAKDLQSKLAKIGYLFKEIDHSWWQPSDVIHYDIANFYVQKKISSLIENKADPLFKQIEIEYDTYQLLPVKWSSYLHDAEDEKSQQGELITLGNVTKIDYHFFAPQKIEDINRNISEVLYDPLGVVVAGSCYGKVGDKEVGNLGLTENLLEKLNHATSEEIIKNPQNYLVEAGGVCAYEFGRITTYVTAVREIFQNTLESLVPVSVVSQPCVKLMVEYYDSFADIIQTRIKSVNLSEGEILQKESWLVSGTVVYNNKGQAHKQYLPCYRDDFNYESVQILASHLPIPTVKYYDIFHRERLTETPKKYQIKTEYSPWYKQHFDENDTSDDPVHKDTPQITILNNLGQAFLNVDCVRNPLEEKIVLYQTKTIFDAAGRPLTMQDPRFVETQQKTGREVYNMIYQYDKLGRILFENSIDSGQKYRLFNSRNQLSEYQNQRNFHFYVEYDNWRRVTKRLVEGGNEKEQSIQKLVCYERNLYGEFETDAEKNNQKGQLVQRYDQTSITYFERYDIQGRITQKRQDYFIKSPYGTDTVLLTQQDFGTSSALSEAKNLPVETYRHQARYDALSRLIQQQQETDKRILMLIIYDYTILGKLQTLHYLPQGQDVKPLPIIADTTYYPTGQKKSLLYGNNVEVDFDFELETQHLRRLAAKHQKNSQQFQSIDYEYDPAGNITRMQDLSYEVLFDSTTAERLPKQAYEYDSLYRLKKATGKTLKEKTPTALTDFFKDKQPIEILSTYNETYDYDKGSNLSKKTHTESAQKDWSKVYPVSETSNRLADIDYDAAGNQNTLNDTEKKTKTTLKWNYLNQLIYAEKLSDQGMVKEFYHYNAEGMRTRKITQMPDKRVYETLYIREYHVKREWHASTKKTEIAMVRIGDGHAIFAHYHFAESPQDEKLIYQLTNPLYSITIETDEKGDLLTYEEFGSYGETNFLIAKNQEIIDEKTYRYSGKEKDEATGLYYYGARYYSPDLGRWLSTDPAGLVDGLNVYGFVKGNPINYFDLTGLMTKEELQELGNKIIQYADNVPDTGVNLWLMENTTDKIKIYLLGTGHYLSISNIGLGDKASTYRDFIINFLQTENFTDIYTEMGDEIKTANLNFKTGLSSLFEDKIKKEEDFIKINKDDRKNYFRAQNAVGQASTSLSGWDELQLDKFYLNLAAIRGDGNHSFSYKALEDRDTRNAASEKNYRDQTSTITLPTFMKDPMEDPMESVKRGNQKQLFYEQANEILQGFDIASAEERNNQWMEKANLNSKSTQLWIIGAAHLPGLFVRFLERGWVATHKDPFETQTEKHRFSSNK